MADISDGDISDNPEQETTKTKQETTNYPGIMVRQHNVLVCHEINKHVNDLQHTKLFFQNKTARYVGYHNHKHMK